MEFDLLVRKYLYGTLSSSELERLRDLLERVPEYRTELRQILELRSIIHDDVLRLIPPRELSDSTRESVGARFAGLESILQRDASMIATPGELAHETRLTVGQLFAASAEHADEPMVAMQEQEETKRRAMILPYRIMGRTLLAASLAIAVALAPTALTPTLNDDARMAAGDALASAVVTPRSNPVPGAPTTSATVERESYEAFDGLVVRGSVVANESPVDRITVSDDAEPMTITAPDTSSATGSDNSAAPAYIFDKDDPLARIVPNRDLASIRFYNPTTDTAQRRHEPFAPVELAVAAVRGNDHGNRFMSVGVTLGSGNVTDADAPAALMQNSYYFSFSVSDDDRVGVEMGGSTFMQETLVRTKRPTRNVFAKQGAGDSLTSPSLQAGEVAPATSALRMKQDITYGGVFYDRRIEVDRAWDLCVRTTVGAADGAIVTGVRAYTAFSPVKNVTLTLGIGGSKLFSLTRGTADESTNYGLYYGVETGF